MIFHVKLLLYDIIWWYSMLNYCCECYMIIFHVKLLLYECVAWLLYGVIYIDIWRYMLCLNYVEFHLLVLRKKWAYDAEVESPGVYNLGSSIKRWPTKRGQQKCLAGKNVLNCFKEPLFCSFWMTNIFLGEGQLLGDSLMVNPYTIHNSKKNIDLEFPYCVYLFTYNKTTITDINPCEGVVRMMENPDDGWWWDVIDKQKLMTRRHLISFPTAI